MITLFIIIFALLFLAITLIPVWLSHRQWKKDFNERIQAVLKQNREWDEKFFSELESKIKEIF